MKSITLIAALAAVTALSACIEDDGDDPRPNEPVVVAPPTTPTTTANPVVSGQSNQSLEQTVKGKGPIVVDASAT